jgi:hypothetical protein
MSQSMVIASSLALLVATITMACGSPDSHPKTFVFTPVPYVTVAPNQGCDGCGNVISVDSQGNRFYADRVLVTVERGSEDRIRDLIDSYGFAIGSTITRGNEGSAPRTFMVVETPPGAAPSVAAWLDSLEGVRHAEVNGIGHVN